VLQQTIHKTTIYCIILNEFSNTVISFFTNWKNLMKTRFLVGMIASLVVLNIAGLNILWEKHQPEIPTIALTPQPDTAFALNTMASLPLVSEAEFSNETSIDEDFDGLDDRWEFMWFGCTDDEDDLWLVDEEWRFTDLETWQDWTISPVSGASPSMRWYVSGVADADQICGIQWITNPHDAELVVPLPATIDVQTNMVSDSDNDNCNNGCEFTHNTQPVVYFGHDGVDTDRDGLGDANEVYTYLTNPTGGDFYYCNNNMRYDGSDGVPDGYDSDCDGVPDGVEVGSGVIAADAIIQPNDIVEYPGKEGLGIFGYPYRPSNPFSQDNDSDGLFDSVDSDGDGLYDHAEYYDANPCVPTTYDTNRNTPTNAGRFYTFAPGTPYECHPDLTRTVSFPTNEYLTSSSIYDELAPIGVLDGVDTDRDGLFDYDELMGLPFFFMLNRQPYSAIYYSHPNYADSDSDGLLDIEELTTPIATAMGLGYTNPQEADTDGDSRTDYEELTVYGTNPLDSDSDFDNLPDYIEINLLVEYGWGPPLYLGNPSPNNPNSDGTAGTGTDSDANGAVDVTNPATGELLPGEILINPDACNQMNDGFEVNALATDPTRLDTDEDGISDCREEMDIFLDALDPDFDDDAVLDGADCDPRDPTVTFECNSTDSDGDGLADAWEIAYFGDLSQSGGNDEDVDSCNNMCEYQRGTNPSPNDDYTCIVNLINNTRIVSGGSDSYYDGYDTDCDGLNDGEELPASSPTNHDTDGDGLIDGFEAYYTYNGVSSPLNPRSPYTDNDDISDYNEVFFLGTLCGGLGTNAAVSDTDGDGLADHLEVGSFATNTAYNAIFPPNYPAAWRATGTNPCNANTDGDGWADMQEIYLYTGANPNSKDTDGDGIQDDVEGNVVGSRYTIFDTRTCNTDGTFMSNPDGIPDGYDTDCDGLPDGDEYYNLSFMDLRDGTPFDGLPMTIVLCEGTPDEQTFVIVISLLSPNNYDSDSDGLSDGAEFNDYITNPQVADTDGDGEADSIEVANETDPLCGGVPNPDDNDADGLTNVEEQNGFDLSTVNAGVGIGWTSTTGYIVTDPNNADSDGDGINDMDEIDGRPFVITYYNINGVAFNINTVSLVTNPTHLDENEDDQPDGYDSDLDGIEDLTEFLGSTVSIDCNNDGDYADTNEGVNQQRITNPATIDTDGDRLSDGFEIANQLDPLRGTCPSPLITNVVATANGRNAITLTWQHNSLAVTEYQVEYSSTGTGNWNLLQTVPSATQTISHTGLVCGSTWYYRVRGYRSTDNYYTNYSSVASATTVVCPPLSAPQPPVVQLIERTGITLSIPADSSGELQTLYLERLSGDWTQIGTFAATGGTFNDSGLACNTTYSYRLQGYRAEDNSYSPYSTELTVTTASCQTLPANTVGLYRAGRWVFQNMETQSQITIQFGLAEVGWQPIVGDWNGDGVDGLGLYRNGIFVLRNASDSGTPDTRYRFELAETGWTPLAGDWNGDGVETVGVYKNGLFLLTDSSTGATVDYRLTLNIPGTSIIPLSGDWDGDGIDTVGLYSNGYFYLVNQLTGNPQPQRFAYGPTTGGWLPLAGDWNSDGTTTIGVYSNTIWRLRNSNSSGTVDTGFTFGQRETGWIPVASYQGGDAPLAMLAATVDNSAFIVENNLPEVTEAPPAVIKVTIDVTLETAETISTFEPTSVPTEIMPTIEPMPEVTIEPTIEIPLMTESVIESTAEVTAEASP
jgi:hypothetical protein